MQTLPPQMLEAIQRMIDQRVEEKVAKFQAEYDEMKAKMAKNMSGMLKSSLVPQRSAQSETKVKPEEAKETRPSTAYKRPAKLKAEGASSKRSDSKESQKSTKEDVKSLADQKKKE